MRAVPAIIIGLCIILAALIFALVPMLMAPVPVAQGGGAVDSGARIDIELMHGDLEVAQGMIQELRDQADALEERMARLESGPAVSSADGGTGLTSPTGPNEILDSYAQVVLVASRRELNQGLTVSSPSYLTTTFGPPRDTLGDNCDAMTNPRLKALLVTQRVGPIEVAMLQPALDSLQRVLTNIQTVDPDLYARINTAGALCVRRIRGSANAVSTHAFGLAVDLNIDGALDTLGDGRTQLGLTILSDFFNAEGWIWGAAFGREDSMHFEISREKVEEWLQDGKI